MVERVPKAKSLKVVCSKLFTCSIVKLYPSGLCAGKIYQSKFSRSLAYCSDLLVNSLIAYVVTAGEIHSLA